MIGRSRAGRRADPAYDAEAIARSIALGEQLAEDACLPPPLKLSEKIEEKLASGEKKYVGNHSLAQDNGVGTAQGAVAQ